MEALTKIIDELMWSRRLDAVLDLDIDDQQVVLGRQLAYCAEISDLISGASINTVDDILIELIVNTPADPVMLIHHQVFPNFTSQSRNFFNGALARSSPFSKHKCKCLFPGCKETAIESHSIQKSFLKSISAGHTHLKKIQISVPREEIGETTIGPKDASTFQGFCASHDTILFRPIEDRVMTLRDDQVLLAAYRSICRELRVKLLEIRNGVHSVMALDPTSSKRPDHQDVHLALLTMQMHRTLYSFASAQPIVMLKRLLDKAIEEGRNDLFDSVGFYVEKPALIASWGVSTPTYDFHGLAIQSTSFVEDVFNNIFVSTFDAKDAILYVISWLKPNKNGARLSRSASAMTPEEASFRLPSFLVSNCEMSFFAPTIAENVGKQFEAALIKGASADYFTDDVSDWIQLNNFAVSQVRLS